MTKRGFLFVSYFRDTTLVSVGKPCHKSEGVSRGLPRGRGCFFPRPMPRDVPEDWILASARMTAGWAWKNVRAGLKPAPTKPEDSSSARVRGRGMPRPYRRTRWRQGESPNRHFGGMVLGAQKTVRAGWSTAPTGPRGYSFWEGAWGNSFWPKRVPPKYQNPALDRAFFLFLGRNLFAAGEDGAAHGLDLTIDPVRLLSDPVHGEKVLHRNPEQALVLL